MDGVIEVKPIEILRINLEIAISAYRLCGVRYRKRIYELPRGSRKLIDGEYIFQIPKTNESIGFGPDTLVEQLPDSRIGGVWEVIDPRYVAYDEIK